MASRRHRLLALAIGIPLGILLGRRVWLVLVDSLSFVYVGPLAGVVLLVIVAVAVAVMGIMAWGPAPARPGCAPPSFSARSSGFHVKHERLVSVRASASGC